MKKKHSEGTKKLLMVLWAIIAFLAINTAGLTKKKEKRKKDKRTEEISLESTAESSISKQFELS